jgi:hypothetical protein
VKTAATNSAQNHGLPVSRAAIRWGRKEEEVEGEREEDEDFLEGEEGEEAVEAPPARGGAEETLPAKRESVICPYYLLSKSFFFFFSSLKQNI